MSIQTKTLSVRIKDKYAAVLRQMAFEINQVFSLANEITSAAYSNAGAFGAQVPKWQTAYDVQKQTPDSAGKRLFDRQRQYSGSARHNAVGIDLGLKRQTVKSWRRGGSIVLWNHRQAGHNGRTKSAGLRLFTPKLKTAAKTHCTNSVRQCGSECGNIRGRHERQQANQNKDG